MCFAGKPRKGALGPLPPPKPCSLCNGRGSIIVPTFNHDFGPGTEVRPCPECHPVSPYAGITLIGVLMVVIFLVLGAFRGCM